MKPFVRALALLLGWATSAHAGPVDLPASAGASATSVLVRVGSCSLGDTRDVTTVESQLGLELKRAGFALVGGDRLGRELVTKAFAADIAAFETLRTRAAALGADYLIVGCVLTTAEPRSKLVRARIDLLVAEVETGDILLRTHDESSSVRVPAALARDIATATAGRRLLPTVVMTLSDHCAFNPGREPVTRASPLSLGLALSGATIVTWEDLQRAGDATMAIIRGELTQLERGER